jgi:hypothetical protein
LIGFVVGPIGEPGDCCFANVACTDLFPSTMTVQRPVPLQAPPHETKVEPARANGTSVTFVPSG